MDHELRSPAGSGIYCGNSLLSVNSQTAGFRQGCSTKGTPGDLCTEFFVFPGMAIGTPPPLRGLFRGEPAPGLHAHQWALLRFVQRHRRLLMRPISVDRMSYKDTSAKQTQNYRDSLNH